VAMKTGETACFSLGISVTAAMTRPCPCASVGRGHEAAAGPLPIPGRAQCAAVWLIHVAEGLGAWSLLRSDSRPRYNLGERLIGMLRSDGS